MGGAYVLIYPPPLYISAKESIHAQSRLAEFRWEVPSVQVLYASKIKG